MRPCSIQMTRFVADEILKRLADDGSLASSGCDEGMPGRSCSARRCDVSARSKGQGRVGGIQRRIPDAKSRARDRSYWPAFASARKSFQDTRGNI